MKRLDAPVLNRLPELAQVRDSIACKLADHVLAEQDGTVPDDAIPLSVYVMAYRNSKEKFNAFCVDLLRD
nr:hypothetical protein [Corynebacterium lactis]